jgi:hypothetical protein
MGTTLLASGLESRSHRNGVFASTRPFGVECGVWAIARPAFFRGADVVDRAIDLCQAITHDAVLTAKDRHGVVRAVDGQNPRIALANGENPAAATGHRAGLGFGLTID